MSTFARRFRKKHEAQRNAMRSLMLGFDGVIETKAVGVDKEKCFLIVGTVCTSRMPAHEVGQEVCLRIKIIKGNAYSESRIFMWFVAINGVTREERDRVDALREGAAARLNAACANPTSNEFVGLKFFVSVHGKLFKNRILVDYSFDICPEALQ